LLNSGATLDRVANASLGDAANYSGQWVGQVGEEVGFAGEGLCPLWSTFHVAEEVGELLG
jgi:hypothetical protein